MYRWEKHSRGFLTTKAAFDVSYYKVSCPDTDETFEEVFSLLMPNQAHKMKLNLFELLHPALSAHPMIPDDFEILLAVADHDFRCFAELLS